ncbi:hypothetical protein TSAR_016068 [Trichomalopsis sarcophagae]|uniref:Uncharacterized protein n=1 Tax=Trichomalopsis sarcophagae TaxID=543379 RepID=A0A232FC10_9HYME|nr:hypothetical protein TSAR_016068 [Trichomalopsis sarcophagae]
MVHGGFPGSALLTQLFRQLTKPASQRIVDYASRHPIFRRYLLLAPGRLYHRLESHLERLKTAPMVASKAEKKPKVKDLKDEEAAMLGSQLMIEVSLRVRTEPCLFPITHQIEPPFQIVIFALLALILTCDWLRSQRKSALEEDRRRAEFAELERQKSVARERLEALELETKLLRARLLEGQKQQQQQQQELEEEKRSVRAFTD